jgi:hypothetical protein
MKLKTDNIVDVSMGVTQELSFELNQDSGTLYEILRSRMYKDPISSIVREIASNSRDANRKIGKPNKPIKVYFENPQDTPNYLFGSDSTTINFKDDGPGMDPVHIKEVYLKYGKSDKNNTNKYTGGWGLGAKTPFAHTDAFSIVTVCEFEGKRTKYSYIASIDKTNKGKFSLVDQEETTEKTGTLVTVPIEKGYVNDFKKACQVYFQYWDVAIKGFERREIFKEYDKFNVYSVNKQRKIFLLVDDIYYPLEDHDDIKLDAIFNNLGIQVEIGLKFNNGEIDVQPNREDISYTRENIKIINDRLESLDISEIMEDVVKEATCVSRKGLKLSQLAKYSGYIKDHKLRYIVGYLYPKYKLKKEKYEDQDYYDRQEATDVVPHFVVYDQYRGKLSKNNVSVTELANLVGDGTSLVIMSPADEKFPYRVNKLALLKKTKHLMLPNLGNSTMKDDSAVQEIIGIMSLFDDVKFDHQIEYTPPARTMPASRLGSSISYRLISDGCLQKPCDVDKDVDLAGAVLVKVENLKEFDKASESFEVGFYKFISIENKINLLFISERYFKHFDGNIRIEDYRKNHKFIAVAKKWEKRSREYTIREALDDELNIKLAYFLYSDLQEEFGDLLLPKEKLEIKYRETFLVSLKSNHFTFTKDEALYKSTVIKLRSIKSKYQVTKLIDYNKYSSVLNIEVLNELEKIKHEQRENKGSGNSHKFDRADKLRQRKAKHQKIGLSHRVRPCALVSRQGGRGRIAEAVLRH